MTARRARQTIHKLERENSVLYRHRFFGGYGEIDDLQIARTLMIDCLLQIQMSRLQYPRNQWIQLKIHLDSLNIRVFISAGLLAQKKLPQILEQYRSILYLIFEEIRRILS